MSTHASLRLTAGLLTLGLAAFGCGGTSAGVGGGGDGGLPDGSVLDGSSMAESGSDAAPVYDAPSGVDVAPMEAGNTEAGGDEGGAVCTGTGTTCTACCRTNNPAGYKTIVTAALACACKPSICGPVDAGAGSDASDIGVGACATTCGGTALPDATCDKCLTDATGSMGDPGECYAPVSMACEADPNCVAYYSCLSGCM